MQGVCPFAFHRGPLSAVCLRYFWWTDCSWGLDSVQVFLLPPFLLSFQHHYVATAHERRVSLYFFGTRSFPPFLWVLFSPSAVSNTITSQCIHHTVQPIQVWSPCSSVTTGISGQVLLSCNSFNVLTTFPG